VRQEVGITQDPFGKIVTPWMFDIKFPYGTQFIFGLLTFAAEEDGNFQMLPLGSAPERFVPVYGQAPCLLAISSTIGGACSGLDHYAGLHIRTVKLVWGIPIMTSILQPLAETSSSSSSTTSPDQDSADDYPEIGGSTSGDLTEEGRLIVMVAPTGGPSQHSSGRYPTIRRSEASDARMPDDVMIRNLNPDINTIQLETIIETIQWMSHEGSPLVGLAQQGVEVANVVVAQ
jgi:hypothetical protein